MRKKSSSIPLAMLTKKFYCHKCDVKLERNPVTRTIKHDDPDYKKYRTNGVLSFGDIQHTYYNFKCPSCGRIIEYDEQCVVEKIQKYVGRHTVSDTEIELCKNQVRKKLLRQRKIKQIVVTILFFALVLFAMYMVYTRYKP